MRAIIARMIDCMDIRKTPPLHLPHGRVVLCLVNLMLRGERIALPCIIYYIEIGCKFPFFIRKKEGKGKGKE
jgi:hypothetical protein